MKRFRGRIIATTSVFFAMCTWNSLYYGLNNYPVNWPLDLVFTSFMLITTWFLSKYYDRTKELNRNLVESKENFKVLLHNTKAVLDNLSEVVFQTNNNLTLKVLNPAWNKLTGYDHNESLETNLEIYIFHEDYPFFQEIFTRCIEMKQLELRYECRIRLKGGGFVWVEMIVKLNYRLQEFIGAYGIITDVTERKKSETELLQVNHLLAQESDRISIVAQLAAGIAHEVRNPLTSINGFLQLMQVQSPKDRQYFDIIFSEIKRIELILSELLVLAKPQVIIQKKRKLTDIIDQVITLLISNAVLYNVSILKEYESMDICIYCEENQIKQVLINLIKNAIESMPDGGIVRVNVKNDDEYVSIFIKDEGVGITEEQLSDIGQPFFTTKETGTGLGLTICFKIVENHHGNMTITSKLNEGSTFEVSFPIHNE